jgi:hypothetical protein
MSEICGSSEKLNTSKQFIDEESHILTFLSAELVINYDPSGEKLT